MFRPPQPGSSSERISDAWTSYGFDFAERLQEVENERSHTCSRPTGDYLRGSSVRQPAVDSYANCRRGDWTAIDGASGIGPDSTRWLVLRPPEGSGPGHSRPLFSNSQSHLPIRRPGDRGGLSL